MEALIVLAFCMTALSMPMRTLPESAVSLFPVRGAGKLGLRAGIDSLSSPTRSLLWALNFSR